MQQYGGLSDEARRTIFTANRQRQEVAHGNQFQGTRADVENYGKFVQELIDNPYSPTPASRNRYAASYETNQGISEVSKVFTTISNGINRLDNEINPTGNNRLTISYLLCGVGFIGLGGLHRLYNGKIGTGLLWLCTGGLFTVGQIFDLFLLPNMVEEYEQKLRAKAGISSFGVPQNQPVVASQVYHPSGNQLMIKLIEVAESRGGSLTVTQGVKATGASFADVELALKEMLKSGYVKIDNDPITGAVTYYFHELG
ncbi:TM2 domain-containing protein [Nostoc sp. FACHB-152]|nr:TM2 domain-containing protein [Nostoc sp. FACHB-152]MBD2471614.1 TM2 domain-containing protein [Nostoc sp. FACHB-145]